MGFRMWRRGPLRLEKDTPARVKMRNGSDRTRAGVTKNGLWKGCHDWTLLQPGLPRGASIPPPRFSLPTGDWLGARVSFGVLLALSGLLYHVQGKF